jgi:hypothetical protein
LTPQKTGSFSTGFRTQSHVAKNFPGWTLPVLKWVIERALRGEIHLG